MAEENSESVVYDIKSNYVYVNNQCILKNISLDKNGFV